MMFFYIIDKERQIFEIPYTEERIKVAMKALDESKSFTYKHYGAIIGMFGAKILNAEHYESYIFSMKPKMFIKNGYWYDQIGMKPIRIEAWRKAEIKKTKLIEKPKETMSEEDMERVRIKKEEITRMYRKN